MPEIAVSFHVKAMTPLCKESEGPGDQSQRGAVYSDVAPVKAVSAYWLRARCGRDGRCSQPIDAGLREALREEFEMRSLPA